MKKFITLTILLISTFCHSQSKWELVYENDADGARVQGELSELISAIQSGQNIRIYFRMGRRNQPEIYVEHTALVKFTTVMNSPNGQFVTGQIDPIVGQIPDFEKEQVLLKENLEWSLIASTTGNNDTMTRNTITGEIVDHRVVNWGTKWYVEKN
ncbi:hypothetical protein [Flagellimonas flava]|uniref:hypothetical protein n=1 Tax=Flagellimonas flava TaxID=570519 RepID=UPI003D65D5B4